MFPAARIKSPTVGRETEAIKGLIDRNPTDNLLPGPIQVNDRDLVVLPAGVQDGKICPLGWTAELIGKLPTSICFPTGRSRH